MGYVFQKDTVFPWRSVERNIALGLEYRGVSAEERERRVRQAIALAGLQEVNCLDCNTLAATITKGGSYKVHVAVRNYGPGNSNANLPCTINVSGNYSMGGYPYAKVLTKKIGVAIAPNNAKAVVFDLGTLDFAPNRSATYQITTSIGSL